MVNLSDLMGVPAEHFGIRLTNRCNLHCEHCVELTYIPFDRNSLHKDRTAAWDISIEEVRLFCRRFEGMQLAVALTGGEPTCVPESLFDRVVYNLHSYGFSVVIQTNGFNILNINPDTLNKITQIRLDDHGINHNHIESCIKHLSRVYSGNVLVENNATHFNLAEAKEHPSNKGQGCFRWAATPLLNRGVIYPCCPLPFIEQHERHSRITDELIKAGWVLCNADIVKVMRSWRDTVPESVRLECLNHCWYPHCDAGGASLITLKANDVIYKKRR